MSLESLCFDAKLKKQSVCQGITTVPSVQITQTPLKLDLTKILSHYDRNYDLKAVGWFMQALLDDILDNSISFVDMFMIDKVRAKTSEKPLLFTL